MRRRAPGTGIPAWAALSVLLVFLPCKPLLDAFATFSRPRRSRLGLRSLPRNLQPPPQRPRTGPSFEDRQTYGESNQLPFGDRFDNWTDYTRYALGVEDRYEVPFYTPQAPNFQAAFTDRKRAIGIDFGPSFVGLAMSLGGTNSMSLGTVRTSKYWADTAIKIVQMASTRRVQDMVIGMPFERDGTEGRIAKLVRHFAQILADTTLLMVGPNTTVYVWDERFSTIYAAMRLVARPRFDGAAFKTWLDGQRGLNSNMKALLDAEAARAILEHWLDKDPNTEMLNKEKSERITPSREACMAYLTWKKKPRIERMPTEPAGPGKEGWEWADMHPESEFVESEEWMRREDGHMEGQDHFGDVLYEMAERKRRQAAERERDRQVREAQEADPEMRDAFRSVTSREGQEEVYDGYGANRPESWKPPRR